MKIVLLPAVEYPSNNPPRENLQRVERHGNFDTDMIAHPPEAKHVGYANASPLQVLPRRWYLANHIMNHAQHTHRPRRALFAVSGIPDLLQRCATVLNFWQACWRLLCGDKNPLAKAASKSVEVFNKALSILQVWSAQRSRK